MDKMDTETKNKFDALAVLWKGAWDQFNERRRYEFQISVAIWTALTAFVAIVITKYEISKYPINAWGVFGSFIALSLLNYINFRWVKGLRERNDLDKSIALHYERKMQELSNSGFDDTVNKIRNRLKDKPNLFYSWSHGAQIQITLLFSFSAFLTVLCLYLYIYHGCFI